MIYTRPILKGTFLERPNRFIAKVLINGVIETVHVKNTGRCRELLQEGTEVYTEYWDTDTRKTKYDLIAVRKLDQIINIDSQAPNKVAAEYLSAAFPNHTLLKPEVKHGNSRFDFYMENEGEKWFIEVKGVTLEEDGIAYFPDAPTERGVKHIEELIACTEEGYRTMVLFIIKMKNIEHLKPNDKTHPAFGATLRRAQQAGVEICAIDCIITPNTIVADKPIPIVL